ncbi:translation initiation factor IF-2-like [Meles meles]|uniref:translation initiation factor IF-2-like n=1 Tax=Meles meles TaxID=9662 RepID=UPI001E69954A|nr:translation initiation factor IF-2-like [Meles meles]
MPPSRTPFSGEGHPRKRAEFPREARSPCAARPPAASGKPRDSLLRPGVGESAARGRPQPGSAPTPGSSAPRAVPPRARAPRAKLGRGDGDLRAAHPLLRSSPLRGEPGSRSPRPGRLDPAPATGTKGNKTSSNPPSRFRRDFPRRGREVGLWGGGAQAAAPAPTGPRPRPGLRRQGFPASPSAASPAPSAPPAPPSEVTETFSCSGKGGEPLPAEGRGCGAGVAGRRPRQLDTDPEDRGWRERARRAGATRVSAGADPAPDGPSDETTALPQVRGSCETLRPRTQQIRPRAPVFAAAPFSGISLHSSS